MDDPAVSLHSMDFVSLPFLLVAFFQLQKQQMDLTFAKKKVVSFINAPSDRDIVFTRNASEAN